MGLGREVRNVLPLHFEGSLPQGCEKPTAYLPGTLVVQGSSYQDDKELPVRLAAHPGLDHWPVILLVDSTAQATENLQEFIWTFFTRFEPAADIYSNALSTSRFHVGLKAPVVFDCRMKPWYPHILEVDPATKKRCK